MQLFQKVTLSVGQFARVRMSDGLSVGNFLSGIATALPLGRRTSRLSEHGLCGYP